ncbi:MAG: hypothetical protein JXR05_04965 [Flavobacteriaceae bacterium]
MEVEIKIWEDKIFPNLNDNIVIHFEIPIWNNELEYCISTKIFWKNNKQDNYKTGKLFISTPYTIYYTFQNEITIKGTLQIEKFSSYNSPDTLGIFADLYYFEVGKANYIWHTEGFLISFDPQNVIVEEIIEVIDQHPIIDPTTPVNPSVSSSAFSDLFPYIYLSGWPKYTSSKQLLNFFYYKSYLGSPPIFTFSEKLSSLKSANDRQGIQNEAIYFIEGKPPYESQYVTSVDKLLGYIGNFKLLYDHLNTLEDLTIIAEEITIFFKTDALSFSEYLKEDSYLENKERLWESYFALIIENGYENENLTSIIEVLTLCNFLEIIFHHLDDTQLITTYNKSELSFLFHANIVLDKNIFPLPPYSSSPPVNTSNRILPYAIGDLQLVQYKLLCYELGEVASITSIMPGEKRKLVNRKLDRVIDKEVSKTISINESFTATNEDNKDFNEELWNAIAETTETTNYPDPGLISTYGPPTNITIQGTYTKTSTTQTPEKKQLSSFAKKILTKTTQRFSEKINKVRSHTELKELEDTSISLLNNSNNKEPIYGIYCWLNKIYQAKVINYGNRMLFSFIVPNPANSYIEQTKFLKDTDLEKPKSLEDFKIYAYQDVTQDNYLSIAQYYELKEFPLYPQETIVVSDVVALSQSKLIILPDLYSASSATIEYAFGSGETVAIVSGFLGQNTFTFNQTTSTTGSQNFNPLNNEQGHIAVSAVYSPTIQISPPNSETDFQMGVTIYCTPLPQTILTWQIELYQLFNKASTKKINAYNLKIGSSDVKKETVNPLTERLTVKIELEKNIRRQLVENALKVNGLPLNMLDYQASPPIVFNQSEINEYLNSALEWNEMSYTFFDEYDNQNGLFSVSSLSPDFFSAFLKASYARVIIPISPEFNFGFLYFLNTGTIWSVKDNLAPCFDDIDNNGNINLDQLSILYHLKKTFHNPSSYPKVIDLWDVLIPTSMQILQNKKSIKIKAHE